MHNLKLKRTTFRSQLDPSLMLLNSRKPTTTALRGHCDLIDKLTRNILLSQAGNSCPGAVISRAWGHLNAITDCFASLTRAGSRLSVRKLRVRYGKYQHPP